MKELIVCASTFMILATTEYESNGYYPNLGSFVPNLRNIASLVTNSLCNNDFPISFNSKT